MSQINIYRGDTTSLNLAVTVGTSSTAKDLTDTTLFFTVKEQKGHSDDLAAIKKQSPTANGINITDATNGLATISLTADETNLLKTGPHWYDVQVKTSAGAISTVGTGKLIVAADITRRTS